MRSTKKSFLTPPRYDVCNDIRVHLPEPTVCTPRRVAMHCYFNISVAGSPPQRVVFQLYPDKCPITCRNFIELCSSSATATKRGPAAAASHQHGIRVEPTYRGTEFHRIIPNFMIQGGDFTNFDGTGGFAAPTTNKGNPTFPDENLQSCFPTIKWVY